VGGIDGHDAVGKTLKSAARGTINSVSPIVGNHESKRGPLSKRKRFGGSISFRNNLTRWVIIRNQAKRGMKGGACKAEPEQGKAVQPKAQRAQHARRGSRKEAAKNVKMT